MPSWLKDIMGLSQNLICGFWFLLCIFAYCHYFTSNYSSNNRKFAFVLANSQVGPLAGMRDFIEDFQYFVESLCWYYLGAFDFIAGKFLALCLVFASFLEEFIGFFLCQILIA